MVRGGNSVKALPTPTKGGGIELFFFFFKCAYFFFKNCLKIEKLNRICFATSHL